MKNIIKTIIKIVLGILAVFIFVLGCFAVKIFVVGEEISPENMMFYEIDLNEDEINIEGELGLFSAVAYRGYKYRIEDGCAYIKMRGVLVSSFYDSAAFDINIKGDFSGVERICVEGKGSKRMILPMEKKPETNSEYSTKWAKPEEGATDIVVVKKRRPL